jgi:hypothetical protein
LRPASSNALWRITFCFIALYFVIISFLVLSGILEQKDYVQSLSAFIGWIVTLFLAVLHFRESEKENQNGRREEVKKKFGNRGFSEDQRIDYSIFRGCYEVSTPYRTLLAPFRVYISLNQPQAAKETVAKFIYTVLSQHNIMLWDGVTPFVLSIESHEVVVIKYDHLRRFIQFRVDDAHEAINKFRDYIQQVNIDELLSASGLDRLEKECEKIQVILLNVTMYLFDYRIELMNELLGDVFDKKVPRREPLDAKFKILTELATESSVREEAGRRDKLIQALGPCPEESNKLNP